MPADPVVSPADTPEAVTVLRRLWHELGPKEQRWLSVEIEHDVLNVLQLSAPELATSPGKSGDAGVGNEPGSGAGHPVVSPADTREAIQSAEEWIGAFRDTWDWPVVPVAPDADVAVDRAAAWTTLDEAATLAEEMTALAAALLAVGERDKAEAAKWQKRAWERATAMEVQGERDRQQIARLTEALRRIASLTRKPNKPLSNEWYYAVQSGVDVIVRAVLAGEEDAEAVPPHSFGEQGIRPEPNHTWPPRAAGEGDT